MKNRLYILLILLFGFVASAQVPSPQIPLTGNIGAGGEFPLLNSGTVIFATDADHTMIYPEMSASFIKLTSSASLTATRNLVAPLTSGFQFTVENDTTGGQAIQVIGETGLGVTIPNGTVLSVVSDGTNYSAVGSVGGVNPGLAGQDAYYVSTGSTVSGVAPVTLNVAKYGAKADVLFGTGASISDNVLNVPSATFTSADVGKSVTFNGGLSYPFATNPTVATISSLGSDAQHVVLNVSATSPTSGLTVAWGTDNVPAFNACGSAVYSAGGGACSIPAGRYLLASAPATMLTGASDDGTYGTGGDGAAATVTVSGGSINTTNLSSGGSGYAHSSSVDVWGVGGTECAALSPYTSNLHVAGVNITAKGAASTNSSGIVTGITWSNTGSGCSSAPTVIFGDYLCGNGLNSQCTNLTPLARFTVPVQVTMYPGASWVGATPDAGEGGESAHLFGSWDGATASNNQPAMFGAVDGALSFGSITGIDFENAFKDIEVPGSIYYEKVINNWLGGGIGILVGATDLATILEDNKFNSHASLVVGGIWNTRQDAPNGNGGFINPAKEDSFQPSFQPYNSVDAAIDDYFAVNYWHPEFSAHSTDFPEVCKFPQTPNQRQTSHIIIYGGTTWWANTMCYRGITGWGMVEQSRNGGGDNTHNVANLEVKGCFRGAYYGLIGSGVIDGVDSCEQGVALSSDPYRTSVTQESEIILAQTGDYWDTSIVKNVTEFNNGSVLQPIWGLGTYEHAVNGITGFPPGSWENILCAFGCTATPAYMQQDYHAGNPAMGNGIVIGQSGGGGNFGGTVMPEANGIYVSAYTAPGTITDVADFLYSGTSFHEDLSAFHVTATGITNTGAPALGGFTSFYNCLQTDHTGLQSANGQPCGYDAHGLFYAGANKLTFPLQVRLGTLVLSTGGHLSNGTYCYSVELALIVDPTVHSMLGTPWCTTISAGTSTQQTIIYTYNPPNGTSFAPPGWEFAIYGRPNTTGGTFGFLTYTVAAIWFDDGSITPGAVPGANTLPSYVDASNNTVFSGIIDSTLTPSTSPICPNGTGGALTTSGCSGGGGSGTVNSFKALGYTQNGPNVSYPLLDPTTIAYALGDSRLLVSSTCKFSGNPSGALSSVTISNGVITFNGVTNAVIGNQYVFQGFSAPYTELNGAVLTVSATDGSSYWSASVPFATLDTENVSSSSWVINTPTTFTVAHPGSYAHYILNVTANGGDSYMGVKELQLYNGATALIPAMTSYTAPSGSVSASSEYGGTPAWNAFNASYEGWITAHTSTGWLQYQFPGATTATTYAITPWSTDTFPQRSPTVWTLGGSNIPDGSPDISGLTGECRNVAPTQIAYSKLFQDSGVPVVNMGVPGGTLSGAIANYTSTYHPLTPAVTGHPAIFILQWDQDLVSGMSGADYVTNINTLLNFFWKDGAQVVVTTPSPYGHDYYYFADLQTSEARNGLIAEAQYIQSQNNSLLVDIAGVACMNNPYDVRCYLQDNTDGHHPGDEWATIIADTVVGAISSNTNFLPTEPAVGMTTASSGSGGGMYKGIYDPTNGTGFVWGLQYGDGSLGATYAALMAGGGGQNGLLDHNVAMGYTPAGTFEIVIPGGISSGHSLGCYGFNSGFFNGGQAANLGCMGFDDANNAFSFDGGTPNDHQGNIKANSATFSSTVTSLNGSYYVAPPVDPNSYGVVGDWSGDSQHFFWYDGARWQRQQADATWSPSFIYVGSSVYGHSGGLSTTSAFTTNTAGNSIVALVDVWSTGNTCTLTDTAGNLYTPVRNDALAAGQYISYLATGINTAPGGNTLSVSCTGGSSYGVELFAMEYHPSGTVTVDGSGMAQAGNACGRYAWCTSPTLTATVDDLQVTFGGNCSWGQVISFNPAMNARANSGTCMYVVDSYVPSTTSTFQYGSLNGVGFPVDMQTVTFKSTP